MGKPYVISAELDLPNLYLEQTIKSETINSFRSDIDANLRGMGKETVWVPSEKLRRGLVAVATKTALPIVSLDDRYVVSADQFLGISRGVDASLNDFGYVPRQGYSSIDEQISRIPALGDEVVVVDDVLFSGEMAISLANALKPYGVKIGAVVVGIAIKEGIEKLMAEGISVEAVEVFDDVEDEICERDFAVVTGSGRPAGVNGESALYFDPLNGRPSRWASIPESEAQSFCYNSLLRNIELLQRGTTMEQLGSFVGYGKEGDARYQLMNRIGKMQ